MASVHTTIFTATDPDIPDFYTWLLNQDLSIISYWPEYNGMSWQEIFDATVQDSDPTDGFIDQVVEENSSTQTTITTRFEDQSVLKNKFHTDGVSGRGLLSCNAGSKTITGTETVWTANVQPYDQVHVFKNNTRLVFIGWVSTVNSDSELTLQHDSSVTENRAQFVIQRPKNNVNDYLTWLYEKEYGITRSTTITEE